MTVQGLLLCLCIKHIAKHTKYYVFWGKGRAYLFLMKHFVMYDNNLYLLSSSDFSFVT
jgi:hypothetical protein